jgi:acylphosphatase
VLFRATCAEEAGRRGVAGFVRNLPDGTVEATFEGPEADVRAMVDWCRNGPPLARVDAVDVRSEDPVGDASFRVR